MKLYATIALNVSGEQILRQPKWLDRVRRASGGEPDLRTGRMRASLEPTAIGGGFEVLRLAVEHVDAGNHHVVEVPARTSRAEPLLEERIRTRCSHLIATLAMLLAVSAANADSHALVGNASKAWFEGEPGPAIPRDVMWAVLPWFTPIAVPPRSVIVVDAPAADSRAREQPVRTAPTWTPVEEVEEHVRGGLALASYLVSR